MDLIHFKGEAYPFFQSQGFGAQYAFPYAKHFCQGFGYDIGCMKSEWAYAGAMPIDLCFDNGWHALNLPRKEVDYIFSSHCLEHLANWVEAMDYWYDCLRVGGHLFLYLPHYDQQYWRPWHNRKHIHVLTAEILKDYMTDKGYKNIYYSGRDLCHSFMIVGEK